MVIQDAQQASLADLSAGTAAAVATLGLGEAVWTRFSDEEGLGWWSDVCTQWARAHKQHPQDVAKEVVARYQGCKAYPNGSLVIRPEKYNVRTLFGLSKIGGLSIPPHKSPSSLRYWCVPARETKFIKDCSKLRPFALCLVHARILESLALTDEGYLPVSPFAQRGETELADMVQNYLSKDDKSPVPQGQFAWLWSDSYTRHDYAILKQSLPETQLFSVAQEWILPPTHDLGIKQFINNKAVSALLLLLASNWRGSELAPLCALFQEEANLHWALSQVTARLELVSRESGDTREPNQENIEELVSSYDPYNNSMLANNLYYALVGLDYVLHKALWRMTVAYYLEEIRLIIRMLNRFISMRQITSLAERNKIYTLCSIAEWFLKGHSRML
jgi:hypothetical protein